MIVAPFIRPIKIQGGTFFTFSSAIEDFNSTFGDSDNNVKFSKYALLDIPQIGTPGNGENYIQFNSVPGAYNQYGSIIGNNLNDVFAESLQNYCLNLETGILLDPRYDPAEKRTVSERVFFKWLKEIGAMRFREADNTELNGEIFGSRFTEERPSDKYTKVVKHLGNIEIMNSTRNNFNAYTEAYIHIPSSHGSTSDVLFNSINDTNYNPSTRYVNIPVEPIDDEVLWCRKHDDIHPAGLNINAHFDSDTGFNDFWYFDPETNQYVDSTNPLFKWWYDTPQDSTYYLEPTSFNNVDNEKFAIGTEDPNNPANLQVTRFTRSKLDGISLEFDPYVYKKIQSEKANGTINDFNASYHAEDFNFNTILVYYDVDTKGVEDVPTSNLFGVLFLDNVDPISNGGGKISTLKKYKPNTTIKANGNSYAFKLNIKWDTSGTDVGTEVSINDYNTFSLQLYIDALNEMIKSSTALSKNLDIYNILNEKVSQLEEYVVNSTDLATVMTELNDIRDLMSSNENVFLNSESLIEIMNRNYQEIKNIYKGQTSIDMSYNLDLIKSGSGIHVNRDSKNEISIHNTIQKFNISENTIRSISSNFDVNVQSYSYTPRLLEFSNYLRITDGTNMTPYEVDRDIIIYIDDENIRWKKGQTFRISFEHGLSLNNDNGNFIFYIFTDAKNIKYENSNFSSLIASIPYYEFERKDNKPVIEITCINPETFEFVVDLI